MKNRSIALIVFLLAELLPAHASLAAINPGDLIRRTDIDTVYYVSTDGKRYAFPHFNVYGSWYDTFTRVDFVSAEEMAAIPFGGIVYIRPGTTMVKIQTDPKVYAVGSGGSLRWIKTELLARSIYGVDWNKVIIDLDPSFFASYRIQHDIDEDSDYDSDFEKHLAGEPSYILDRSLAPETPGDPAMSWSSLPSELQTNDGFFLTVMAIASNTDGRMLMAGNNIVFARCENAISCQGIGGPYTLAGTQTIHSYACDPHGNCKRFFLGNIAVRDGDAAGTILTSLATSTHADPYRANVTVSSNGALPTQVGLIRTKGPTDFCANQTTCMVETPSLKNTQFEYRGFACDAAYRCRFTSPITLGPLL